MSRRAALPSVALGFVCVAACWGNTDVPTPIDASTPPGDSGSGSDAPNTGEGGRDSSVPQDVQATDVSGDTGDGADTGGPVTPCSGPCPSGCCDGVSGACVGYSAQSATACGTGGATCVVCSGSAAPANGSVTCPNGSCLCNGATGCGAGQSCCNTGCIDLQTDDSNCGTCGHDCGGAGACKGGTCQPIALANNVVAGGIAIDSTTIFFYVGADVYACALPAGCGASLPSPIYRGGHDGGNGLLGIAYDVTHSNVVVSDPPDVVSIPTEGGGVDWTALTPGLYPDPFVPTTSGNALFVGTYNLIAQGDTQAILNGGGMGNLGTLCSFDLDAPALNVAYDSTTNSVFAAVPNSQLGAGTPGALLKCLVGADGGAFDSLSTPTGASDVVVSKQTVYIAVAGTSLSGGIYWSPTDTLSLNSGAVGASYAGAQAMTADATYLYFGTTYNVYRCSIASHCTDATLIAPVPGVRSMANDASFVYWAGSNNVAKLAKAP
jgi:hypothetical protein